MSSRRSFNTAQSRPARTFEEFECGWVHDVTADGEIVYALDDTGEPVAKVHRIRLNFTPFELLKRIEEVTAEDVHAMRTAAEDVAAGKPLGLVRWLDMVCRNDGLLMGIAEDPTVTPAEFDGVVTWVLAETGIGDVLDMLIAAPDDEGEDEGVDEPDPFDPASESPQPV